MTEPARQPPRSMKGPALAAGLLLALLASFSTMEGDIHRSYWDHLAKVWTICRGVTGPDIVKDLEWTKEQCLARETAMLNAFNAKVTACIRVPISMFEHFAFLHFAWNVGVNAFCGSTLVKKLNARDYVGACNQILRWVFIRGKDCRVATNKCRGLPMRREFEHAVCMGRISIPGLPDLPLTGVIP